MIIELVLITICCTIGSFIGSFIGNILSHYTTHKRVALRLANTKAAVELLKEIQTNLDHGYLTLQQAADIRLNVLTQAGISIESVQPYPAAPKGV